MNLRAVKSSTILDPPSKTSLSNGKRKVIISKARLLCRLLVIFSENRWNDLVMPEVQVRLG